jgi:hypothetical protein
MVDIRFHSRRQAAAAMQMHERRKRAASLRLAQIAIHRFGGLPQDRFAAFQCEAALQRCDLVARAFELHVLGGMCGEVDRAKRKETDQRERYRLSIRNSLATWRPPRWRCFA